MFTLTFNQNKVRQHQKGIFTAEAKYFLSLPSHVIATKSGSINEKKSRWQPQIEAA
jgi:hypothetical protein